MEVNYSFKRKRTNYWMDWVYLSWTNRRFDDISCREWFLYKYDRRHDLSFVFSHKFNDKFDIGLPMLAVHTMLLHLRSHYIGDNPISV